MFKDLLKAKNYVKNAINELNSGQKISDPITKPMGVLLNTLDRNFILGL